MHHTDSRSWTRRTFLKTSVVGLLLLGSKLLLPASVRANELPDGELTFFNVHTNERLRVRYRDDEGHYDLTALDEVNHVLRCHHTGEVAAIDVQLLEHVNLVHKTLAGAGEIHVISGYRLPSTMPYFKSGAGESPAQSLFRGRRSILQPGVSFVKFGMPH